MSGPLGQGWLGILTVRRFDGSSGRSSTGATVPRLGASSVRRFDGSNCCLSVNSTVRRFDRWLGCLRDGSRVRAPLAFEKDRNVRQRTVQPSNRRTPEPPERRAAP